MCSIIILSPNYNCFGFIYLYFLFDKTKKYMSDKLIQTLALCKEKASSLNWAN